MSEQTYDLELSGCSSIPLAHYLKALGVFRLVAKQVDPNVKAWWKNDRFWLRSKLDSEGLVKFFLEDYQPTPVVAPWNGGSGFYPSDNTDAITSIALSTTARLLKYRETIDLTRAVLNDLRLEAKPTDQKPVLLQHCRNCFPDENLAWLDAAYVITADGPKYPPILGTGANDGRLEFTNNFMQHLIKLINPNDGHPLPNAPQSLLESLFNALNESRASGTIGQFDPASLGGANNGTGFDGLAAVNSWDYILMIEGAMAFAAASVKKIESAEGGVLSYPFCVRQAGVGYGSADRSDEESTRSEMWLPIWNSATPYHSITTLMSEGRVETGKRKPRNGVDFARAIASLGVDRGISEFQRFAFQQRNGLAFFAVPLGRFSVVSQPSVDELLAPLDRWLDRFRRAATGQTAPARAGRALRQVESAIMQLCQRGNEADVQGLLIALGEAEAAIAISKSLREGNMGHGLNPVPLLSKQWVLKANDHSPEFRLAVSLASIYDNTIGPFRRHLEPIDLSSMSRKSKSLRWTENTNDPSLVWGSSSLVKNLTLVFQRRLIDLMKSGKEKDQSELLMPLRSKISASLGDIAMFINNELDDAKIEALLKGLILVDWSASSDQKNKLTTEEWISLQGDNDPVPDAAYSLLKLCHLPKSLEYDKQSTYSIRLDPQISRRAIAHDLSAATKLASRRLRISGLEPAVNGVFCEGNRAARTVAALLFPISDNSAKNLVKRVILKDKLPENSEAPEAESAVND